MKVVDIADEVYRELGSPADLSIPAISFWLRTNIGSLNNHINTSFTVNLTSYEIEQDTTNSEGTAVTLEIAEEEKSIFKKMYMIHYYDSKIRSNIVSISSDSVISVTDDGSSVTKINKNEVSKMLTGIKKQEFEELKNLINQYNLNKAAPLQVAGDDTVEGFYAVSRKFNRIPNNYVLKMASLLTTTETTNLVSILGDVFDTFKRQVVIHKAPKKVISQINESQLFGYGEAANPVNYTYTPQSGVYHAKISYIESKANEYVQDFQSNIDNNIVRMKVQDDARAYIESGTTENVTFDNKTFNLIGDNMVKNFLGPSGYTTYVYYLRETK